MTYIDKDGRLRNTEEELKAFNDHCRERVKTPFTLTYWKNTEQFLDLINLKYDAEFASKKDK